MIGSDERREREGGRGEGADGKDGNIEGGWEGVKEGKKERQRKIEACVAEITLRNIMSYYST